MDKEVLDLAFKYPELMNNLSQEYRNKLFSLWLSDSNKHTEQMTETDKTAFIYVHAKFFDVSYPQKVIQSYLGIKRTALEGRLAKARVDGKIPVKSRKMSDPIGIVR